MIISYLGKDGFLCEMCSQIGKDRYVATPDIPSLVEWKSINLCKKCAKREVGSKNKKRWDKIHDVGTDV